MSKNMLFKVLIALCFVAVAVVWALSAAEVITVRLDWLIAVFAFVLALVFILRGLFSSSRAYSPSSVRSSTPNSSSPSSPSW